MFKFIIGPTPLTCPNDLVVLTDPDKNSDSHLILGELLIDICDVSNLTLA